MENFNEYVSITEKFLINWARPEGWIESPLATWPLTQFDIAIKIAIGYLAFVLFGSVCFLFILFILHSLTSNTTSSSSSSTTKSRRTSRR